MRHLNIFCLMLVAMVALGLAATASSFAVTLPDISIALGGSYPLHLEVTLLNIRTVLDNTADESFTGTGLLLLLSIDQLTSLGSFEMTFQTFLDGQGECSSEVNDTLDPAGEILTLGTFHIVLRPDNSLGILYLFQPVRINCAGASFKLRGSVLSSISNATGTEGTEYSSLTGRVLGSQGKPELTEYLNDGGTIVGAKLEVDFGTGFITADLSIEGEVTATALEGKMFVVKPR